MSVFLRFCQICSYGCTIGTVDTMEFENLNFGMFGLVWLGYVEMVPKMLDLYTKIRKNAMVLKGSEWS